MLLLLTGCAFWFGEADLAAYPITRDDLLRTPQAIGPSLPPGFAVPTVRSVAPEPLLLEVSTVGYPEKVQLGELHAPLEFTDALRGAAGGVEVGIPVEVVVERFQLLCLGQDRGAIRSGAHMVVEGAVSFGEGPWQPIEVTRYARDCDVPGALYAEAGAAFGGEVGRLAETAPRGEAPRPLPASTEAPVLCTARDVRPRSERSGQRAAEVFGFYTVGVGVTTLRGSRVDGDFLAGDARVTAASEALTNELERALHKALPGLSISEEPCPETPYERVSRPTVWARLDHAWVSQYVRSTAATTQSRWGYVTVTTSEVSAAATEAFAYWRAGVALCVEDVCRGTTVAGTNDAEGNILEGAGPKTNWERSSKQALERLGQRTREIVEGWRR